MIHWLRVLCWDAVTIRHSISQFYAVKQSSEVYIETDDHWLDRPRGFGWFVHTSALKCVSLTPNYSTCNGERSRRQKWDNIGKWDAPNCYLGIVKSRPGTRNVIARIVWLVPPFFTSRYNYNLRTLLFVSFYFVYLSQVCQHPCFFAIILRSPR